MGEMLGNRLKGKEIGRGSIVENTPRKCFADISNLPKSIHDMKIQGFSPNTKEYIHKLHQEIVSLRKILADKNKVNELEQQKWMKICQQLQQQNRQYAQTNSQMLGELNSAKDKLKVLQHELGCKNGLLVAKNLESEVEPINCDDIKKSSKADTETNVPCNEKRTRQLKSIGNNSFKPVQVQVKIGERRRSIRLKNVEQVPTKDVSDTLLTDKPIQNNDNVDEKRLPKQAPAMAESSDTLDPTTSKPVQAEAKTDDKRRRHSRRQSSRFKVEEERSAKVENSDALNLTTSKPVQTAMTTVNRRRQSRRLFTRVKAEEESAAMVESSDTLDLSKHVEDEKKAGD